MKHLQKQGTFESSFCCISIDIYKRKKEMSHQNYKTLEIISKANVLQHETTNSKSIEIYLELI